MTDLLRDITIERAPAAGPVPLDSLYLEVFWQPVLGPTAFSLLRWLHRNVGQDPLTISAGDIGRQLGVPGSKIRATFGRLERFALIRQVSPNYDVWLLPRGVRPVDAPLVMRLPFSLRELHRQTDYDTSRLASSSR